MTLAERIVRLAKLAQTQTPVVSVYLNTRWNDEHQRERTRVFLKTAIRKAREKTSARDVAAALDWIETQGDALISQAQHADASGVALFACPALGLRELVPVRVPIEDAFVVSDAPYLRPLAAVLAEAPTALVVFVDTESARLIPLSSTGAGEEVRLDSEVPGRHSRGGWAQLAQSRYQRHTENDRGHHLEAVGEALARLRDEHGVERIVLAGHPDTVAAFRRRLPPRVDERVAGTVPGSRHEPAMELVSRAIPVIDHLGDVERDAALDDVLTDAAKGRQAAAGLEEVLEAVSRGAVRRLYLLRTLEEAGRACADCGVLQPGTSPTCRLCGHATAAVELGEALVNRTLAAGGRVAMVEDHEGLAAVGGVAAQLRFPL